MSDTIAPSLSAPTTKRSGVSAKALSRLTERVQRELNLSDGELSGLLGVSEKTLKRRKQDGSFDRGEALQLEIFGRVLDVAFETFADPDSARAWLRSPVMSLDKKVPISLLTSLEGYERVTNILYRQVDGMF